MRSTHFATLVHIGSGLCEELSTWQGLEPDRVALVEPNPDLAADLETLCTNYDNVTYLPVALSTKNGRAPFHSLNFLDFSSLTLPDNVNQIYPGARSVSSEVETVSPGGLLERLQLDAKANNALIWETPGTEAQIFAADDLSEFVNHFSTIVLRLPVPDIFPVVFDASAAITQLEMLGFQYVPSMTCNSMHDDWYQLRFHRLPASALQAQARLTALEAQKNETEALNEKLLQEVKSLSSIRNTTQARLAEQTQTLEQQAQTLEQQTQTLEQQAQTQEELQGRVSRLTLDLAQAENSNSELPQLTTNLNLALRLHTKTEESYKELQQRYAELMDQKNVQEDLLLKLTDKLSAASQYMQQLAESPAEMSDSGSESALSTDGSTGS